MSGLIPYVLYPGTASQALHFYQSIFGGEVHIYSYAQAGRDDGPGDGVAHGMLIGPVELAAADAAAGETTLSMSGMFFSLLGTAPASELKHWFAALAEGGTITDPLQKRPWGDRDGTVIDKFGVSWLIGYHG